MTDFNGQSPDVIHEGNGYFFELSLGIETDTLFLYKFKVDNGIAYYLNKEGDWLEDGTFPMSKYVDWADSKLMGEIQR